MPQLVSSDTLSADFSMLSSVEEDNTDFDFSCHLILTQSISAELISSYSFIPHDELSNSLFSDIIKIYAKPTVYVSKDAKYINPVEQFHLMDIDGNFILDSDDNYLVVLNSGGYIQNKMTILVNGLNFDLLDSFYLSSTMGNFDLMEYYNLFPISSYGMHMVSAYPPFYGLELDYDILDENFALVHLRELSSFENGALVAVNSGGYYVRKIYGEF